MLHKIPLFPLPNHVVLPHMSMPYRLFEERYRALGAYLLEHKEDGLFIPCLQADWEKDYEGNPPFHELAVHCSIQGIQEAENGEFALLIQGHERYRLKEVDSDDLFRFADAEEAFTLNDMSDAGLQQSLLALAPSFRQHMSTMGVEAEQLKQFLDDCTQAPALLNRMAHVLFSDPVIRQQFLDAPAISDQIALLRLSLGHRSSDEVSLN